MFRIKFITQFIAVLLVFSATQCLLSCQSETDKNISGLHTNITFVHYFTDSLSGGINEMAQAFNRQNDRYYLNAIAIDHEAFEVSIRPNFAAESPPDVYSYWAGARTESVLKYLEPLDDVWQQYQLDERFTPLVIKAAVEYQGKKYFVPLTQHSVGFFYNKKIFERYHLTPPHTWLEFIALCEILKTNKIIPIALGTREKWASQFWFDFLLLRTTPYEQRQQLMHGKISYQHIAVTSAFERWVELITKNYFNSRPNDISWDSGANEMVYSGKAAMTLMGSWIMGQFNDTTHRWVAGKDYDFFPFPMIDNGIPIVALGPIDGLVVPRQALNKNGAKEVLVFLTEAAPQLAMSQGSGSLAPSLMVAATHYNPVQQRLLTAINQSAHFAFPYDLSTPPEAAELGVTAFTEILEFPTAWHTIQQKLATDMQRYFEYLEKIKDDR